MGVKTHLILFNLRIYTAEEKLGVMDKFFFFIEEEGVGLAFFPFKNCQSYWEQLPFPHCDDDRAVNQGALISINTAWLENPLLLDQRSANSFFILGFEVHTVSTNTT